MKILLIGEYSNVHWTLAQGLRALGHQVTVVSDGDGWKNYERDISLVRRSTSFVHGVEYTFRLLSLLPKLRGYDVVQIINPVFLQLKAEKMLPFYKYLRKHNGRVFMGAFGMDKYWVKAGIDCHTFRYSDFNLGAQLRESADNTIWYNEWILGAKGRLNDYIANDCDGIVSGLYEYDASYRPYFANKLRYIPFPLDLNRYQAKERVPKDGVVEFFIGIQKTRNVYKGTDIMLRALRRVEQLYPNRCHVNVAEQLPFEEYVKVLDRSHVILDQLYSYTPAMNALQAMAQGLVVVGGGEEENYQILGEQTLRPIVNVQPDEQSVVDGLIRLVESPEEVAQLSRQSIEYVRKYHDCKVVAQQYLDFYEAPKPPLPKDSLPAPKPLSSLPLQGESK